METEELLRRIEARLSELGMSARGVSLRVTGKPDLIRDIRRRSHDLKSGKLKKLAEVLQVPVGYLLDEKVRLSEERRAGGQNVPLRYRVAAALRETTPAKFELSHETERTVQAPRDLALPEECFAAELLDDSGVGLRFPPGTILFVRPVTQGAPLRIGDRVLVRDRAEDGSTIEILAGMLGYSSTGELIAATHAPGGAIPSAIVVRAAEAGCGLADRRAHFRGREEKIRYAPETGDRAEILGTIEKSRKPVRG